MYNKKTVYRLTFGIALAGLMFGIDVGVMSGVLPLISKSLKLSTLWIEIVTSSMLLGAAFGGIISKWISFNIGRRNSIVLSGFIFIITFIGSAIAPNQYILVCARFILGIGLGIESLNTPLYLAEISPKDIRGKLTGSYQLMITIGVLLAFLSDTLIGYLSTGGLLSGNLAWRLMIIVAIIPAVIMIYFVWNSPRSPRWLVLRGKYTEAESVLKFMGMDNTDKEVNEIKKSLIFNKLDWHLLLNKRFLYVIGIGVGLQLVQQFCCKNMLNYYAPKLFEMIGIKSYNEQMWTTTLIVGVTSIVFTYVAMGLVDKYGRKTLLYISGSLILLGSLMVSTAFVPQMTPAFKSVLGISAILVYMIGYGIGYGPVIWIVCAEIFPLQGKELGMSFVVLANWIGNFTVGMVTLSMLQGMGVQKFFIMVAFIQVLSIIFFKLFVPETKNKSLEEIERELFKKKETIKSDRQLAQQNN